jgi:hypothetical protein
MQAKGLKKGREKPAGLLAAFEARGRLRRMQILLRKTQDVRLTFKGWKRLRRQMRSLFSLRRQVHRHSDPSAAGKSIGLPVPGGAKHSSNAMLLRARGRGYTRRPLRAGSQPGDGCKKTLVLDAYFLAGK